MGLQACLWNLYASIRRPAWPYLDNRICDPTIGPSKCWSYLIFPNGYNGVLPICLRSGTPPEYDPSLRQHHKHVIQFQTNEVYTNVEVDHRRTCCWRLPRTNELSGVDGIRTTLGTL